MLPVIYQGFCVVLGVAYFVQGEAVQSSVWLAASLVITAQAAKNS